MKYFCENWCENCYFTKTGSNKPVQIPVLEPVYENGLPAINETK